MSERKILPFPPKPAPESVEQEVVLDIFGDRLTIKVNVEIESADAPPRSKSAS